MKSKLTIGALIAVIIFFVLLYVVFAKVDSVESVKKTETQKLRVGFVLLSDTADNGWNETHYKGIRAACDSLGVQRNLVIDIPEERIPLANAVTGMIADSLKVIVLTSYNYPILIKDIIESHPEVTFYGINWEYDAPNYKAYFARIYQARYLAGIVAGAMTKTNHVGFVAAMKNIQVYRGLNAFILGVQSVNPEAKVYVRWTNSWNEGGMETENANKLIDSSGIDVIAFHQDRAFIIEVAEKRGLYCIGNHVENNRFSPRMLTSIAINWGIIYKDFIQDYIQKKDNENMDYWVGLEKDAVGLAFYSSEVPDSVKILVNAAAEKIKAGYNVFSGRIEDVEGKIRSEEGETISDEVLHNEMNWLIKGAIEP
jgi:basic membrane protein A